MRSNQPNTAVSRPKKLQTLRLLVSAVERLASTLQLEEIYEILLEVVRQAMPCDGFLVSSYNAQSKQITCVFGYTDSVKLDVSQLPPIPLQEDGGMQSEVIRTGESRIYDVRQKVVEPGGSYYELNATGKVSLIRKSDDTPTKFAVMVPIKLDGIVVGVLQVMANNPARDYDSEDLGLLEGLVHQVAIGGQNARLYERARTEIAVRKHAEEELRRAEGRLSLALNAMPNIAWWAKPDGTATAVNKTLLDFAGIETAKPLLGTAIWTSLVHRDELSAMLSDYEECFEAKVPWEAEMRLRRFDGHYRWHLARTAPLLEADGTINGWFGTCTDIHDLKIAKSALETALENAPDPIFRIGSGLEWIYLNPAARRQFKFTRTAPIGKSIFEGGLSEEASAAIREGCRVLFEGAQETSVDFEVGSRIFTARAVRETPNEQSRLDALFVCLDVTGQREEQDALSHLNEELERRVTSRTQELADSNHEMEAFTYSISHDIRTPLRAISATSHILLEDHGANLDFEVRALLHRQAEAAQRLGRLLDELLKYSRISRSEMHFEEIDLSEMVAGIREEVAIADPEAGKRITIEPNVSGFGDPTLVRLLISNLIENALKFSKPGTEVSFGASGADVFFVQDQGKGIDPRFIDKIWEPFERLGIGKETPGVGIGLANVKRLIERHQGRIWVSSELGKGSTFYFALAGKIKG